MKHIFALLFLLLASVGANAQCTGIFPPNYICGNAGVSGNIPGPIPSSGVLGTCADKTLIGNISGSSAIPVCNAYSTFFDSVACSTNGKVFGRSGGTWGCVDAGTVTSVSAGTGMSFTTITSTGAIDIDKATSANLAAGTTNKTLTADIAVAAPALVALTPGTTVTPDLNTGYNFSLSPGQNFELMDPLNISGKTGRSFCIVIKNDTTPRTISFDTEYFAPGGTSTITLTASNGALDQLCALIYTASEVFLSITKNYSR